MPTYRTTLKTLSQVTENKLFFKDGLSDVFKSGTCCHQNVLVHNVTGLHCNSFVVFSPVKILLLFSCNFLVEKEKYVKLRITQFVSTSKIIYFLEKLKDRIVTALAWLAHMPFLLK